MENLQIINDLYNNDAANTKLSDQLATHTICIARHTADRKLKGHELCVATHVDGHFYPCSRCVIINDYRSSPNTIVQFRSWSYAMQLTFSEHPTKQRPRFSTHAHGIRSTLTFSHQPIWAFISVSPTWMITS